MGTHISRVRCVLVEPRRIHRVLDLLAIIGQLFCNRLLASPEEILDDAHEHDQHQEAKCRAKKDQHAMLSCGAREIVRATWEKSFHGRHVGQADGGKMHGRESKRQLPRGLVTDKDIESHQDGHRTRKEGAEI